MSSVPIEAAHAERRQRRARGYESPRPDIMAHVPVRAANILDLGCSVGALGAAIKARQDANILGVDIESRYAREAASRIDRVIVADVESFAQSPPPPEAPFDCLIAADVLEHLVDPWKALERCCRFLQRDAVVIVSLPNVLYWPAIRRVLRGTWPLEDQGVFDRTHLRWFTRDDARSLVASAGLEEVVIEPHYWQEGWRVTLWRSLDRMRIGRFLPAQHIVVAKRGLASPCG
jgi:2-polyprenyl-3-methyl-5-hydroxy-6-metoxy-1,4-benzoquinol methylase